MTTRRLLGPSLALLLSAAALTSCGDDDSGSGSADTPLSVVATTNVWGSIAQLIGGDAVTVTSFVTDPSQDPHSYEANATNVLEVEKGDLLVENGGGYDDWMDELVDTAGTRAPLIIAVTLSGKKAAAGEELNEHVWYDFPTAAAMADKIADELGTLDPDDATDFQANAEAFDDRVHDLIAREAEAKVTLAGKSIGITEPVPLYLTAAMGLLNATPAEFSEAVEEGDDVPVPVLADTLARYAHGQVDALVYNEQTSGPVTEKVEAAAADNDIPVVPVTETLPEGKTYLEWMAGNLDAIVTALS